MHVERRQEIADALNNGGSFNCHKTIDYSDGEGIETKHSRFCNGAMLTMDREGNCYENQMVRMQHRFGMIDPENLDHESPVFCNLDEWVDNGD